MSSADRFGGRHPLCICPEDTFTRVATAAERAACRDRSFGITHKVMTTEDMSLIVVSGAWPRDDHR